MCEAIPRRTYERQHLAVFLRRPLDASHRATRTDLFNEFLTQDTILGFKEAASRQSRCAHACGVTIAGPLGPPVCSLCAPPAEA